MKSIGILFVFLSISVFGSPIDKELACDEGWETICFEDTCNCYQFVDGNLRYDVAKQICNGFGGDLPSVHSDNENKFLYVFPSRFDKGAWLGLTRNSSFSFAWSDGTAFDYSNWRAHAPSNGANKGDCVHFVGSSDDGFSTAFQWGDSSCNDPHPVICQKSETSFVPSTTPAPVPACPGNYTLHCLSTGECNCYSAVQKTMRWQDALSFCASEGTDLISIHSAEEGRYAQYLSSTTWIGITVNDTRWSDGSVVSYTDWAYFFTNGYAAYYQSGQSGWLAADIGTGNYFMKNSICKIAANE